MTSARSSLTFRQRAWLVAFDVTCWLCTATERLHFWCLRKLSAATDWGDAAEPESEEIPF